MHEESELIRDVEVCRRVIAAGAPGVSLRLLSSTRLADAASVADPRVTLTTRRRPAVLTRLGYRKVGRINWNGETHAIWTTCENLLTEPHALRATLNSIENSPTKESMNSSPSSVQQVAVMKAMHLLNAAKAEYAIRMPDGQTFGGLPIAPPPKRARINNFVELVPGYNEQIKKMIPGDVLKWEVEESKRDAFRQAVSACANTHLGKGTYITTITEKGVIELLRVE